jgi:hypothetical protein
VRNVAEAGVEEIEIGQPDWLVAQEAHLASMSG